MEPRSVNGDEAAEAGAILARYDGIGEMLDEADAAHWPVAPDEHGAILARVHEANDA